jgi:hypothetical protein
MKESNLTLTAIVHKEEDMYVAECFGMGAVSQGILWPQGKMEIQNFYFFLFLASLIIFLRKFLSLDKFFQSCM